MFGKVSAQRKVLFGAVLGVLLIVIIVFVWALAMGKIKSKADSFNCENIRVTGHVSYHDPSSPSPGGTGPLGGANVWIHSGGDSDTYIATSTYSYTENYSGKVNPLY